MDLALASADAALEALLRKTRAPAMKPMAMPMRNAIMLLRECWCVWIVDFNLHQRAKVGRSLRSIKRDDNISAV